MVRSELLVWRQVLVFASCHQWLWQRLYRHWLRLEQALRLTLLLIRLVVVPALLLERPLSCSRPLRPQQAQGLPVTALLLELLVLLLPPLLCRVLALVLAQMSVVLTM